MAMYEKRFSAISPQLFVADGDANGIITVANATLFKVKQEVRINATALPQLELEVKSVVSITKLIVGPRGGNINQPFDISQYTVAAAAFIDAAIQKRPAIDYAEIMRAVYDEEPSVALRNILVDKLGNKIDTVTDASGVNRIAVDSEVTVNTVQMFTKPYDAITATYPSSVQEIYVSHTGGVTGPVQETVTVNYTDSTKNLILNVART